MARPSCVVHVWDLPAEKRPRFTKPVGVGALVRSPGDATGLTHMGVHLRSVEPGLAGTNRHFHMVEEEWSYVLAGRGVVRIGPLRIEVWPGSFVAFPPGPRPHHFVAQGDTPLVFLEGGERRRDEDYGFYPDLGKRFEWGKLSDVTEPFPPEEGDPSQCVQVDELPIREFQHDVDPHARRLMRRLDRPTGLKRQSVCWTRVEPSAFSSAYHTHTLTDEWVYILAGRARARVGDDTFEVGPHDFIGHPAGSAPHQMQATEALIYLMGGERSLLDDVMIYPEAGVRRVQGKLERL